jgi:thiol-disulfide isomerase/thioredoxin
MRLAAKRQLAFERDAHHSQARSSSAFGVAARGSLALGVWLAVLLLVAVSLAGTAQAEEPVELVYFADVHCASCAEIREQVLDPLQEQYGERLRIVELDIAHDDAFEVLLALEQEHGVFGGEIPEVFVGEDVFAGPDAIYEGLAAAVERYMAEGGATLPPVVAEHLESRSAYTPTVDDPARPAATEAASTEPPTSQGAVVHAVIFWSPTCPACHVALEEVLPAIQEQYGSSLVISTVSIATEEAQTLWFELMTQAGLGRDNAYIPMLFVGDRALIGADVIAKELPGLIDAHLASGGVGAPAALQGNEHLIERFVVASKESSSPTGAPTATLAPRTPTPTPTLAPIHAIYFSQIGCESCDRAERDLDYIESKYPQLVVEHLDVREAATLNEYLAERIDLPERLRLVAPSFFVGDDYLVGSDVRVAPLRTVLAPYLETGSERFWEGYEQAAPSAEQSIVERFQSLNLLAVMGAGLLDGVNPCAFATIIFLVSYLALQKRSKSHLLLAGLLFAAGVFATYLAIGLGMFTAMDRWAPLDSIGRWLYLATAVICLALAWGSFVDFRRAREGRLEDMTLKLPDRFSNLGRRLIRERMGATGVVISSLLLGAVISLIELACTGQVYLPTIVFVLGVPGLRARATIALVLYNLMFVFPLIVVLLLVYYGTSSRQLVSWLQRRAAAVKLGMAVLFAGLGVWLLYNVIHIAV